MKDRILPPEEWPRVEHLPVSPLIQLMEPKNIDVVVVEDDDGKIVAACCVLHMSELEGFWIDPDHGTTPGVARRLLRSIFRRVVAREEWWAFAGVSACDAKFNGYIERLGGVSLPAKFYVIPAKRY